MEMHRDPIKSYYKELVKSFANIAPKDRKRLSELLSQDATYVELVGGGTHMILGSEARDLASLISKDLYTEIRIPIMIAKISGSPFYRIIDCNTDVMRMLKDLREVAIIEGMYIDRCILSSIDAMSLMKKYKTLFIISIIYEGNEGSQYNEDQYG